MEQTIYSLPQRQQELNAKVREAVLQKVDFDEIKSLEEKSDLDRFFKIDVASEYREVTYIIEILTSGDPLYISRALRCTWLYDAEYMTIINPDYLQSNVFPLMSIRMIKKTLITISKHIREENRALSFFKYCKKIKFNTIAFKFLIFCSEKYKLEYLETEDLYESNIAQFVGNSFSLAEKYLDLEEVAHPITILLQKLCYLYSVCNETYLDLFESYCDYPSNEEFGIRISKNILTKHKERVMEEPQLYLKHLNINMVIKHSTVKDAKFYLNALMPSEVAKFWCIISKKSTKILPILKILPENERFNCLTQIFMAKYPGQPFESAEEFYRHHLFELMTFDEKEAWALKYLKENTEGLDTDEEYLWCKYVNFELAFSAIKKYIKVTTNCNKRSQMLNILIDVAGTEENLTKVINYYYDRHINERENVKEDFVNKINESHNVLKFQESCWNAFNKILYSMEIYTNKMTYYSYKFKILCIIYHIINNKDVPDTLHAEKIYESSVHYFEGYIKQLTKNQNSLIYQYYLDLYTKTVETYKEQEYNENIRIKLRPILYGAINIFSIFKKTKKDCPEVIMKYIKLDWSYFEELDFLSDEEKISQDYLIRLLKQNPKLLLDKLPDVKTAVTRHYLNYTSLRLNRVMKKTKVYFWNDIAKDVLKTLEEWFLEMDRYIYFKLYNVTICSILQIADEEYKIKFISKYAPTSSKIVYDEIDHNILQIQANICKFALYSRPPLPLQEILKYIKGDYLKYCLPMFDFFCVNLPRSLARQFIEANLDCPVSVQKHGIRLAFHYFNINILEKLVLDSWAKTKNIFLRKVIYNALYNRVVKDKYASARFYELLKMITSELHEDDDDDIFNLFCSVKSLPNPLKSDFIELVWTTVKKLPNKSLKNVHRQCGVIITIKSNIRIMDKEFCRKKILDKFIKSMLYDMKIQNAYENRATELLINEKWNLAKAYIIHFDDSEQLNKNVELVSVIIEKCFEMWDYSHEGVYTIRHFLMGFLNDLLYQTYWDDDKVTPVLQSITDQLRQSLPIKQIYLFYCKLNFVIISKQIMGPKEIESESGELNYSHLKMTDVAANFTDRLVKFLMGLKRRKMLYTSYFYELASEITNILKIMTLYTKITDKDLLIVVCDRLTDVQKLETFTLATMIIPIDGDIENDKNLSRVLNKIVDFDQDEVESLLWNKMMNNNYRVFITDNTEKKARNSNMFYFSIFVVVSAAVVLPILNPFQYFF